MKSFQLFFLFVIFNQSLFAQFSDSSIVHHVFQSEAFDSERKVTVHLPSRYFNNPEEEMMVTYVLDAQGPQYFNMLLGNLDYLTSRYRIIPTIVVGIHSPDRYAEFTPNARSGNTKEWEANFESQLPNLQEHFEKEVFPLIESNYRTRPFRAIVGHSRGGSFVIQSLFDGHDYLFDAYLAISPAISFDDNQTIDKAAEVLKSKKPVEKFLFVSSGNVTGQELYFDELVNILDSVVQQHPNPALKYHRAAFSGKDHFTTVLPALNEGMVFLKNEHMPSFENIYEFAENKDHSVPAQIDEFIRVRKEKGIFVHEPSIAYYSRIASEFMENEDYKNALDFFVWIDKKEPFEKWWEIFNLGKCYHYNNDKEKAKQCFDTAMIKIEDWKEQYGEKFERIKSDVQQEINELGYQKP